MWTSTLKPHLKRNAVSYVLFFTAFFGGIGALGFKALFLDSKVEETSKTDESPKLSAEEALTALRRVSQNALQICYDSGVKGFLLQYDQDGEMKWWFIKEDRGFWRSENGTWMTKPIEENEWVQIGPDTTGLKCNVKQ